MIRRVAFLISVIPQNQKKRSNETSQFFYDMNAPSDDKHHKKNKRAKIEFDQNKCWFCLASSNVEKHLIVTVGSETYVALAKGTRTLILYFNNLSQLYFRWNR